MGIFDEQITRKPNRYAWSQDFIDAMWAGHWTPNEFNFKADYAQFTQELTQQERDIVVHTLSAIGQIEIAVKTFWARLGNTLPHPSIVDMGITMAAIEVIHNQAYEKLLTVLDLEDVFETNMHLPVIQGRVNYLRKYLDKNYKDERKQFIYSLILFTLFVENVSLFSQFYVVLWFNRYRNVLKDTAQQVQYTKNEELLHAQAGIKLIQTIRQEYPELFDDELEARILNEAYAAFIAEMKIIDWILGDFKAPYLDTGILTNYVADRINQSLEQIGFEPIEEFKSTDEQRGKYAWMDEDTLAPAMTDFFHKRPVEYNKNNRTFNADELF